MTSEPTVTISLPSRCVERRASRDCHEFFVARLPEGTRVGDLDLSGWHVCAASAHDDGNRAGITQLVVPGSVCKRVRRPRGMDAGMSAFEEVDPTELRDAVEGAFEAKRRRAVGTQVARLVEAGDLESAYEALGTLLNGEAKVMPPDPAARREEGVPKPFGHDMARGYEAVGILPAFLPTCSADTRSPVATVPERFTHVAFDEAHCVTREFFQRLLDRARSRPPRYAGALDEHGIGYVAHQLAHPLACGDDRPVAEVNGIGVSFGQEVMAAPGARIQRAAEAVTARDVTDLGAVSVYVDRASLIERHGMSADEASVVAERICSCAESELALATNRIGAAHVSSLLRSPDATRVLLESGASIENPTTGERMRLDPSTGRLACDLRGIDAQPDDPAFLDCCLLHVATDDCWRVSPDDAVRIATGGVPEDRGVREAARSAYLADDWLYPRQRQRNLPTREQAMSLLSVRDATDAASRTYALADECRDVRSAGTRPTGTSGDTRERVA